jgi:acyl carrier protein
VQQRTQRPLCPRIKKEHFQTESQGYTDMTREEIQAEIIAICCREFEMENPDPDDDLREKFGFDSIDGIELLIQIEKMLKTALTQEEKKQSLNIRTINQVCDYIETIMKARTA